MKSLLFDRVPFIFIAIVYDDYIISSTIYCLVSIMDRAGALTPMFSWWGETTACGGHTKFTQKGLLQNSIKISQPMS